MHTVTPTLNMLILMQHDLPRAVAFYRDLGLPLKFHISRKWAEFDLGSAKLGLVPIEQELPERRTGIVLEVPDVNAFYTAHKESDIQFLSEPVEAAHGIILTFKDPGNNIIDIYQPTPEKVRESIERAQKAAAEAGCCGAQKQKSCCNSDISA
jgi:catechol 2,3-dioxygenase-like lactoylglutathione lyase family enzyme